MLQIEKNNMSNLNTPLPHENYKKKNNDNQQDNNNFNEEKNN